MTEVPEIVGDATEWAGLFLAAASIISLLLGLLWKAFKINAKIERVVAELDPDAGEHSLRAQVDATRALTEANTQSIEQHTSATAAAITLMADRAQKYDEQNEAAHRQLHARIDGLFELLAGSSTASTARRLAEQHRAHREQGEP